MIDVRRLPYSVALQVLRATVPRLEGNPELWARNSFVLGTLKPFVSDLDLSVWYENQPSPRALKALHQTLRLSNRFFPHQGEANVYDASLAKAHQWCANRFEIERDPRLGEKLGFKPRATLTRYEAGAFLLRMLEGDLRNVVNRPVERKEKWNSHVAAIERAVGYPLESLWGHFPAKSLLRGILECAVLTAIGGSDLDSNEIERIIQSLEMYFEFRQRGVSYHVLRPLFADHAWWLFAMPHRFCFESDLSPFLRGGRAKAGVAFAEAQLRWELWGVLGQHALVVAASERDVLKTHLESIARAASTLGAEELDGIRAVVDSLLVSLQRAG